MKSFRPSRVARDAIEDIEYGKRSDFINRCIEKFAVETNKEVKVEKQPIESEKPDNPQSNKSGNSQGLPKTSSSQEKPSSETGHGAKLHRTQSKAEAMKNLLKKLSQSEGP